MRKKALSQLLLSIHTSNLNVTRSWAPNSFFVLPTRRLMIRVWEVCFVLRSVKTEKKVHFYNFLHLGMPMPQWDFQEPCAHEVCGTLYEIIWKQIIKLSCKWEELKSLEKFLSKLMLFMVNKETHLVGNQIPVFCSVGEQVGCCRQCKCISMSETCEVTGKNMENKTSHYKEKVECRQLIFWSGSWGRFKVRL